MYYLYLYLNAIYLFFKWINDNIIFKYNKCLTIINIII